jgi:ketosteroid isomerase-like protein
MSTKNNMVETVAQGWALLGAGDFDGLAACYAPDMVFVLPGQDDVLEGRDGFRAALDNIGAALPPGFDIKALRYCAGENEVANVVEWTSTKLPDGSQSVVLFKFDDAGQITEERWFVDTEQWKAAF